jgi:AraC-like DNA-binding protein
VLPHADRCDTALPRLRIYSSARPTELLATIYDPVVCLILQGAKRTVIGGKPLEYGAGDCVVVAAEVAAMVQISRASPDCPYLALNLSLDPAMISALLVDMAGMPESSTTPAFSVSRASALVLDAWRRMVELLDRPDEMQVMAPRVEEEVLFRLLMGPQGSILRQIAGTDSRLLRIRRAMAWIREHYAERLSIGAIADIANMSPSVFHRRFKAVTGLSPLQYQKQVRLHEARRQILSEGATALSVGLMVGYESASQFSREYKRLFGEPPRRDASAMQSVLPSNNASAD